MSGDRLSSSPVAVQVHILSFLDTKQAVQTSLLSKQWVNLWTLLSDFDFISSENSLRSFDATIRKLLSLRNDSDKINSFALSRSLDSEYLERILDFISSHCVQRLTITSCDGRMDYECRMSMKRLFSFDFLESLKLEFVTLDHLLRLKQLVTLHLERVTFGHTSQDFSGCPNLESLTLKSCYVVCGLEPDLDFVLVSPKLSKLTFSNTLLDDFKLVLSTPRLTFFGFTQSVPVFFEASCDMHLLHTIHISDFSKSWRGTSWIEKLITMLKCFSTAKVVKLSSGIIKLLSRYPDMLAREPSPFHNLRSLHIILSNASQFQTGHETAYLIQNSPDAEVVTE